MKISGSLYSQKKDSIYCDLKTKIYNLVYDFTTFPVQLLCRGQEKEVGQLQLHIREWESVSEEETGEKLEEVEESQEEMEWVDERDEIMDRVDETEEEMKEG